MSRLFVAIGLAVLTTCTAAAQFRYMPGVRAVPTYSPMPNRPMYPVYQPYYYNTYRPGIIGMPNPLANPYFAAEYYQMRYGYNPYYSGFVPYVNPYPVVVPVPTPVAVPTPVPYPVPTPVPVAAPAPASPSSTDSLPNPPLFSPSANAGSSFSWFPHEIRVLVPAADAKVSVNGVSLNGSGTERKITVDAVKPGNKHEYKVNATWTQDGKPVTRERTVVLDGTGHGIADFR